MIWVYINLDEQHALSAAHCFVTNDFSSGIGFIPTENYVFQGNRYTQRLQNIENLEPEWIKCHQKYIQGAIFNFYYF